MAAKSGPIANGCLTVILSSGFFIVAAPWEGWVVHKLWGWYIVTAFGVPPVRTGLAIGIALLAGFLTSKVTKPSGDSYLTLLSRSIAHQIVTPASALLFGWIFHVLWG